MLTAAERRLRIDFEHYSSVRIPVFPCGLYYEPVTDGKRMEKFLPVVRPFSVVGFGYLCLQRPEIEAGFFLKAGNSFEHFFHSFPALRVVGEIHTHLGLVVLTVEKRIVNVVERDVFFVEQLAQVGRVLDLEAVGAGGGKYADNEFHP